MSDLMNQQKISLGEFNWIIDLLAVPADGIPLPDYRQWMLPCVDRKAFADYPRIPGEDYRTVEKYCLPLKESKSSKSGGKDSPKPSGRK